MHKFLVFSLLSWGSLSPVFASFDSYYPSNLRPVLEQSQQKDQELKNTLFLILNSYHQKTTGAADQLVESCATEGDSNCYRQKSLGYDKARVYLFGQLHLFEDSQGYYLEDVYCNKKLRNGDNGGKLKIGPMIIPSSNYVNCEHTWPQSRFTSKFAKEIQRSDLHHLFSTNSRANNERGNSPFGETNGGALANCSVSSKGKLATGSGGNYFQPPKEHRGNVARALFYFSVRYQLPIDATQERFLRQWHNDDPVDSVEVERNNQIENLQWNRNPFIDFPELVNSIKDF